MTEEWILFIIIDGSRRNQKFRYQGLVKVIKIYFPMRHYLLFTILIIIISLTDLHLWHWKTFSPQLAQTPGLAGTDAEHLGH